MSAEDLSINDKDETYLNIEKSLDFIDQEGEENKEKKYEVKEMEESKNKIKMSSNLEDLNTNDFSIHFSNNDKHNRYLDKVLNFNEFEFKIQESKEPKKSIKKKILHKIQSNSSSSCSSNSSRNNKYCNWLQRNVCKSTAKVNHESKEFKNPYPCCDSVSESERLSCLISIIHDNGHSYKIENKWSMYLLNYHPHPHPYHPHQLKDPDVKYYNPRKGLETIDGLKYNSLPQTNSLLKEIQYEFNFNFFSSVLKFTRHRKRTPRIKLASVFDINEMEKLTKDFNENKDYRHQRKIKYKKY